MNAFDEVRHLRVMADHLRRTGELTEEDWQAAQNRLGELDRMYYAEEKVSENPLAAIPLAVEVPGEYVAKSVGLSGGRSQPTLESIASGYRGIGRGLSNFRERAIASILRKPLRTDQSPIVETSDNTKRIDPVEWRRQMQERTDLLTVPNAQQELESRIDALLP